MLDPVSCVLLVLAGCLALGLLSVLAAQDLCARLAWAVRVYRALDGGKAGLAAAWMALGDDSHINLMVLPPRDWPEARALPPAEVRAGVILPPAPWTGPPAAEIEKRLRGIGSIGLTDIRCPGVEIVWLGSDDLRRTLNHPARRTYEGQHYMTDRLRLATATTQSQHTGEPDA